MTEQEAKEALFKLHSEYMSHSPKERLELYSSYKEARNTIKNELSNFVASQKQENNDNIHKL